MEEIWKPVVGYEGRYEVSNLGRVKALHYMNCNDKVAIMKDEQNQDHYKRVELRYEGRRTKYMVHRLVAEAFIPNPENKRYVDHINGDRHDNRTVNLRWCSHKENMNFAGVRKTMSAQRMGGKNHYARKVIQKTIEGIVVAEWDSLSDAARAMGCCVSNISLYCHGHSKTAAGFVWVLK